MRKVLDTTDLTLSLYSGDQETLFKTGHELCSLAIRIFQMHEVSFGAIRFIRIFPNICKTSQQKPCWRPLQMHVLCIFLSLFSYYLLL